MTRAESSLNYFLIQSFSSSVFIFSFCFNILFSIIDILFFFNIFIFIMVSSLIIKLGIAPFHFWFPNVSSNISWEINLILITWQKITPIFIIILIGLEIDLLIILLIIISSFVGSIGIINEFSLRKLISYSSINHLSWLVRCIVLNYNIWLLYFLIYSFLNFCIIYFIKNFQIYYLSQLYSKFRFISYKLFFIFPILSIGGLPPFLGFLPKLILIYTIVYNQYTLLLIFLIFIRLFALFVYLNISFRILFLRFNEMNIKFNNLTNTTFEFIFLSINTFISIFGISLIIFIFM